MTPFEVLCKEPEQINPAILLAEELMRKPAAEVFDLADIDSARKTLEKAKIEIKAVESQFTALVKTKPKAGSSIPIGF
jgi:hypothetical protein